MGETRIIKRYANRKLYDTQHSCYVTLEQVAGMIRAGDDIQIVDNTNKEDLTAVTLAQIIFEEEKRKNSFLPLHTMRNIIQSSGESISHLVHQAKRNVSIMLPAKRKDPVDDERGADPDAKSSATTSHSFRDLRDWVENSQRAIDDWQKRVDDRIRNVVGGMSPIGPLHKGVRQLAERIAELEAKLAAIAGDESRDPKD